jgi:hypothetical protein
VVARTFTKTSIAAELARARANGWEQCCSEAERAAGLPAGLLLALASRETDMNDVVGDSGHGRGLFQIDDRWHSDFLGRHGAGGPGGKPPVRDAARYAAELVRANLDYARKKGIPERDRLKFALSAYNAGAGGAWSGYRAEDDSDARTTGRDYGRDVLARFALFQQVRNGPAPRLLKRGSRGKAVEDLKGGSRGKAVEDLKRKLAAWYRANAPGEFERFGVKPGPFFAAALDEAVRDFQRRAGLEPDGVVGPNTRAALER